MGVYSKIHVTLPKEWNLFINLKKIDRVGPVDNRPSTDSLHHFVQLFFKIKKKKLHVTRDM